MNRWEHGSPLLRRRSVLAGWGTGTLLAVCGPPLITGCHSDDSTPASTPSPTSAPDEELRRRAVDRVRGLQNTGRQVTGPSQVRVVLSRLAENYPRQLAALGEPAAGASGPASGAPSNTASALAAAPATARSAATTPAATGSTGPATPAALVAAQTAAATESLTGCAAASTPGMAVLLARLAAAHAAGADLLAAAANLPAPGEVSAAAATSATGGTTTGSASAARAPEPPAQALSGTPGPAATSLGPTQVTALSRLLHGEHAAVYAYGVVTARVTPGLRTRARTCWTAHLSDRDDLIRLLTAAGARAPAASPAYDIKGPPSTSSAAVELAATVESRLATLAASAVGATTGSTRVVAAELLVAAARHQTGWVPDVAALPGG